MTSTGFKNFVEGIGGAFIIAFSLVTPFLRPWRARWGTTDAERRQKLPGDELIPKPRWQYTNAITIEAPVTEVWPWLLQMGQGRGGLYSYDGLENLVGCDIHSTDRILPEFQKLEVGDRVRLYPEGSGYPVVMAEVVSAIVLHADTRTGDSLVPVGTKDEEYYTSSWGFYLQVINDEMTRLLARFRTDYSPGLKNRLFFGTCLVEPISTAMQRKMLWGIKQRAEAAVRKNK